MPKYRVTFRDGSSTVVSVSPDAETSRESLQMIAKRRAVKRKYNPGTMPDLIEKSRQVEKVERS